MTFALAASMMLQSLEILATSGQAFILFTAPASPFCSTLQVIRRMSGLPFAGTDCAQPMMYALMHRGPVDVFVVRATRRTAERWVGVGAYENFDY